MVPTYQGAKPIDFISLQTFLHVGYLNGIFGYPWLNVVFWTLAIEFQFYLLICVVYGAVGNRSVKILLGVHAAMLLASFATDTMTSIFKYLALFSTGIAAFQYRAGLIRSQLFVFIMGVSTLVIASIHGGPVAFVTFITGATIAWGYALVVRSPY